MRGIKLDLTSWVTVGHDEHAITVTEGIGAPDGLVQKTRETDGMRVRAVSVHDEIGVGDVVLVVAALDILTVPARRKHDFQSQAISAVGIEILLVGHVVAVERALGVLVVVEAVEAQCSLAKAVLVCLAQSAPVGLFGIRHARVTGSESTAL